MNYPYGGMMIYSFDHDSEEDLDDDVYDYDDWDYMYSYDD